MASLTLVLLLGWVIPAAATEHAPETPAESESAPKATSDVANQAEHDDGKRGNAQDHSHVDSPDTSQSATTDPKEAARQHFAQGLELGGHGDYQGALREFTTAYLLSPHFAVLYNIGQAQIALGRPLEAAETLSKYLRDGQDQVPPDRLNQVQAQIALLASLFAELTITTDRPGVAISLDGHDVGRTPLYQPLRVAAGTHVVSATADSIATVQRTITIGQGEHQILNLMIPVSAPQPMAQTPSPQSAAPAQPPAPTQPPSIATVPPPAATAGFGAVGVARDAQSQPGSSDGAPTMTSIVAYASAGVGVALGAGALGVYFRNRDRYQEWQQNDTYLRSDKNGIDFYDRQTANNRLADSLTRDNHIIAGLAIGGGVLFAGGVALFVYERFQGRTSETAEPRAEDARGGAPIGFSLVLDGLSSGGAAGHGSYGLSSYGLSWSASW